MESSKPICAETSIENLYTEQGKTLQEISQILNISITAVINRLKDQSVERRPKGRRKKNVLGAYTISELRDLKSIQGKSYTEIAKEAGCSRQWAWQFFKNHKI